MSPFDEPTWTAFVQALDPRTRPRFEGSAQAHAELAALLASAQGRWPELTLDPGVVAAHIAARLDPTCTVEELRRLHGADLAIAAACLGGDSLAHRTFEIEYGPLVRSGLKRLECSDEAAADLEQQLWERLLVGSQTRGPKLADYRGTGALGHWLRVVIARMRADVGRARGRRAQPGADAAEALAVSLDDPEFAYLKVCYHDLIREAFAEAVAALAPRQRTVLRCHLVEGLGTEQIGAAHGVHPATARRWLAAARQELYEGTKRVIVARAQVSPSEFESMLRLVHSRLNLSVTRLLEAAGPSTDGAQAPDAS